MALPKVYAAIESVEVGGETFEVRVLTRAEAARFQKMITAGAPGDELEVAVIAAATDTPIEEVREWYGATPAWAVQELIDGIQRISRLDEGAQKSG
jgi:hypothetical protein